MYQIVCYVIKKVVKIWLKDKNTELFEYQVWYLLYMQPKPVFMNVSFLYCSSVLNSSTLLWEACQSHFKEIVAYNLFYADKDFLKSYPACNSYLPIMKFKLMNM
jgi:hypothetical protein